MIILLTFAFLAGLATIIAPCILPILPIVLAAGTTGGHKRPLGIISGLIVSFTVVTLVFSYLVGQLGLSQEVLRYVAVLALAIFGLVLLIPRLLEQFEIIISRLLPQKQVAHSEGYGSGFLAGLTLGLIWAPCSGPIMTSVIALAASQGISLSTFFITLAFAVGAAIPLLAVMYGGRAITTRLQGVTAGGTGAQKAFGVIMLLTALAIAIRLDQTIQVKILDTIPALDRVINIDNTEAVRGQLRHLQK